tara:strand:+ start:79 stop:393 length:315 start_codon:yes stop_codon:yes gene_type:complete
MITRGVKLGDHWYCEPCAARVGGKVGTGPIEQVPQSVTLCKYCKADFHTVNIQTQLVVAKGEAAKWFSHLLVLTSMLDKITLDELTFEEVLLLEVIRRDMEIDE